MNISDAYTKGNNYSRYNNGRANVYYRIAYALRDQSGIELLFECTTLFTVNE